MTVPANPRLVLERLKALHPRVIDLSLDRIERILAALGHPERSVPPVIHVAGTNGKGSVVAFLRAMLEADDRTCHVYTSPHLVRFNERIVVAGREIEDDVLASLLSECETVNDGAPITFFEITTAAALLAFQRTPADVCLLETGLGGRLDATNVVTRPLATLITAISRDHESFLGSTLQSIAREKAGILKAGVPCLSLEQASEADAVLEDRACDVGAPLFREGRDWQVMPLATGFRFESGEFRTDLPAPALEGSHQMHNGGLALACVHRLGLLGVSERAMRSGIAEARWPGRLQRLRSGPLVSLLPTGWELWLDGGHNPGAGQVLAAHVERWRDRPTGLVFGMLNTKDTLGFLEPFAGRVDWAVAVPVPKEEASVTAQDLAGAARKVGLLADPAVDVRAALSNLVGRLKGPARILIAGSLYLAGWVLRENR
jgi:dihydrofolate synthase/folylpolyglutamate synthase